MDKRQHKPDTRARVAARRKARKQASSSEPTRRAVPQTRSTATTRPSQHVRDRLRNSRATRQARSARAEQRERRSMGQQMRASALAAAEVVRKRRNTTQTLRHERQKSRHKQIWRAPRGESQVRPGPRQTFKYWLISGRLASLLLFLASVGMLGFIFTSPQFRIQQVVVEGNSVLQDEAVAQMSGLEDTSIWFVDTAHASDRLLNDAYVEQTSISVKMPNQAVIKVSERRPEMRWELNGVQYLLDRNGTVLDIASEPAEPDTLVIVGSGQQSLEPMAHVDPDALKLAQALALRLPRELGFTPTMIGWDIALGIYVKSELGQTIVFGRTENLDRKLALLQEVWEQQIGFSYLDLRPLNPYIRNEG